MNKYLIIDFDSTINKLEALDELAKIVDLKNGSSEVSEKIAAITELGMKGEISFDESLTRRMDILKFDKNDLEALVLKLKENFTDSFISNRAILKELADSIIVISGGFKDFIVPALNDFDIKPGNIYANTFEFDSNGVCIGFDASNPLASDQGKVKTVSKINLQGQIVVVGDGFTDYQIKDKGMATKFVAFVENVNRPNVVANADFVANNFDQVFKYFKNLD